MTKPCGHIKALLYDVETSCCTVTSENPFNNPEGVMKITCLECNIEVRTVSIG